MSQVVNEALQKMGQFLKKMPMYPDYNLKGDFRMCTMLINIRYKINNV